ncbi:MAG: DNA-protecting protein DprA [Clostridiales bacterium]|nr:DNA-protecting protein DprA [Clostridiales bacterium]
MINVKYTADELCLIWLDSFLGLEYKHKQALYKLISGKVEIKEVLVKGKEYVVSAIGSDRYDALLHSANQEYLNSVIEGLSRKNVTALTITSKDYPFLLKNTDIPPLVLYALGDLKLLSTDCFSIVGSRKSLPLSINLAKEFALGISDAGFTVVTGNAEGVESAVIESLLNKNKKVISVLAGGIDNVYPKSNTELIERVINSNGLVISEYPPEVEVKRYHYPIRNRILAGLSKGVLIVSGGVKSGTTYTAEYALEYGRDVFAIPYSVGVPSGAGCNAVIKEGGHLCDSVNDVLDFYGIEPKQKEELNLSETEREIIKVLNGGGTHIEKIATALNKRVFELTPTLSVMEIKGLVVRTGVNTYGLTRNDLEE